MRASASGRPTEPQPGHEPVRLTRAARLGLSWQIALRELRSGLQGFYIFLSCLTLSVAAIATIGSFSKSVELGLSQQGQAILGGDIELRLVHRQISAEKLNWLKNNGTVAEVATMRTMAIRPDTEASALVELKSPGDNYPLFGQLELTGGGDYREALSRRNGIWGLIVDPTLAQNMGVKRGDILKLGNLHFKLRALIAKEPDRVSGGFFFGPRVMVSRQALAETGLVQPGSLIYWHYKLKLAGNPTPGQIKSFQKRLRETFPNAGWRIRGRNNAAPGTKRFIDRLTLFLSLVGLTALIVGGLGIGNAVRNFLEARRRNIAMLKCLGAPASSILEIYFIQVLLLASTGIGAGLVLGAGLPILLGALLSDVLPLNLVAGLHLVPLLGALAFGFFITLAFALWPLGLARNLPATALFRSDIQHSDTYPLARYIVAMAISLAMVGVLALLSFPGRLITFYYFAGITASFAALFFLARMMIRLIKYFPKPRHLSARMALANLHRPGAPTVSVTLSLGIGLALFVTLALIDTNLTRELRQNLPEKAPSFFFLDIQPGALDRFGKVVAAVDGVEAIETVPMLRGRIVSVKGVPSKDVKSAEGAEWALRGDRGLTYSKTVPRGSKIVSGNWWAKDYSGPPLVSFTKDIADGLKLKVGDSVVVNVLGREITATISSLRLVDWGSLGINFVMVFSPDALRTAPHTHLATVIMDKANETTLLSKINKQFPTITAVRVRDALNAVSDLLGKLLIAVRGSNIITLFIGILVLIGAMTSGLKSRIYDAVIFKTLGATRRQLLSAHALEYALLGTLTSVFAVAVGALASWVIIRFFMRFDWIFDPAAAIITVVFAAVITVLAGFAATWRALTAKVAPRLRVD